MDVFECIKNRRSIRRFSPDEIEEEKLDKILDAARWAPSAGNLQARDIIVVRNPEIKKKLMMAALGQDFILEAPVVLVVCANKSKSAFRYGIRGEKLYCIQDATASIQNILLAAHALGLGSCWVGAFDTEIVKRILEIPGDVEPIAIIPIGYPGESPSPPPRKLDIHEDKW